MSIFKVEAKVRGEVRVRLRVRVGHLDGMVTVCVPVLFDRQNQFYI